MLPAFLKFYQVSIFQNCTADRASSTFYVVSTASAKFSLRANKIKCNTENEEKISIRIIIYFYLCIFLCITCNKNMLKIVGKIYNKVQFTT